jgi:hypothetical protein
MQFNKETPVRNFIIQDHSFQIPAPFNEGHTCTASEAGVLNQTLAENVRNNLAKRVKESVDKGEFDQSKMQAEIDQYLEEYEFGQRRGRGPTDPVEREALNIAKDIVKNALREQGIKLADVDTADLNDLAQQTVEANPAITKEAESRVKKRNEIGNVSLPDLKSLGQPREEVEAE